SRSQIYQDYEQAFSRSTGLPLKLRPSEVWQLVHQTTKYENPFCSLLSKHSRSCAACLQVQQKIVESPGTAPKSVTCFAGMCDTAVPVKAGNNILRSLHN